MICAANRRHAADCKDPPFDFLGFTHSWVKSQKGKNVVRQTTAKSRFARALLAVKDGAEPIASAHPRTARLAVCQARWSLCLLRHHGELAQTAAVSPRGHQRRGASGRMLQRICKPLECPLVARPAMTAGALLLEALGGVSGRGGIQPAHWRSPALGLPHRKHQRFRMHRVGITPILDHQN
jgi:hypothetical protein